VKELEWIGVGMMKPMAMRVLERRAVRVIQEELARVWFPKTVNDLKVKASGMREAGLGLVLKSAQNRQAVNVRVKVSKIRGA
jgi:hypothetical protein